tara:strand:+ start:577 stop:894 length:318 start_codon:yes stop_codon:yes gene_type:complete
MIELFSLLALMSLCLHFLSGQKVRELALYSAKRACKHAATQFLDESVSLKRISMSRDHKGIWRIWRLYHFEYSYDGEARLLGRIAMLGYSQQALLLQEPGQEVLH